MVVVKWREIISRNLQSHVLRVHSKPGLQDSCARGQRWRRPGAQGRDAEAHAHLGALDVVVQVVPERVDQVDGIVSSTGVGVAREQH